MCELIFNLDKGLLGKYQVGADTPEEFNAKHLHDYNAGYSISVFNNQISAILVCFRYGYRKFDKFEGAVSVDGSEYRFTSSTTVEEIKSILGNPIDEWNDGVEQGLDYSRNDQDIQIVWHVDGKVTLDYISVES